MEKLDRQDRVLCAIALVGVLFLGIVILSLTGCATTTTTGTEQTWQERATDYYAIMGVTLTTAKATVDSLAVSGAIDKDRQKEYDRIYKTATDAYETVGTLLQTAIRVQGTAEEKGALAAYQEAMSKLPGIVGQVTTVVKDIENGGAK